MLSSNFYPDFFTATILEWKKLLRPDKFKDIIINSLQFLVREKRVTVYAFVIMDNHIHIIWQAMGNHIPSDIQLSFMRYTAQMMLKELRNKYPQVLEKFAVKASDRTHQVWERRPLSTSLWNQQVFKQKLDYIHNNPVDAGMCEYPYDYRYSSACFYFGKQNEWHFLSHYQG
jgi:putative transposase